MLVIDRFEGEMAVVEYSSAEQVKMINIYREALPAEAGEGDIIKIIIDKKATEERAELVKELGDQLFK